MTRARFIQVLPFLWVLALSGDVRADGGVIRSRETQGPFIVTIFTAPELVKDGVSDVSVMVQRLDSTDAILDATVDLMFTAPASSPGDTVEQVCGQAHWSRESGQHVAQFTVPATRQQASNKLLYAAAVEFDSAGNWRLQALIERGGESVKTGCNIPVGLAPGRLFNLFPYLLLPPLMVTLFVVNQILRGSSFKRRYSNCFPSAPTA